MNHMLTNIDGNSQLIARKRGAIQLRGSDAAKFLQGQVTCDLMTLADEPNGSVISGAQCTPKGRMIFDFSAFYYGSGEMRDLILITAPELVELAIASLKKYAVFFKVEISDVSTQWQQQLLFGTPPETLPEGIIAQPLSSDITALTLADGKHCELNPPSRETADGRWLNNQLIAAGVAEVSAATTELFIPQMLNFDHRNFISFKKGCYTGQEIVARAHYRGAVKRRLARGVTESPLPALLVPGSELRDNEGRALGTVAAVGDRQFLVAATEAATSQHDFTVDSTAFTAELTALAPASE